MAKFLENLKISVEAWMIQDGLLSDIQKGNIVNFGLGTNILENAKLTESTEKAIRYLGNGKYEIVAEVIYFSKKESLTESLLVFDFGLVAYFSGWPPVEPKINDYISAFIILEPRCDFLSDFSEIVYDWRITHIYRQAAPLIEVKTPIGGRLLVRDKDKLGYLEIEQTNAWEDDDGNAEYFLSCTLINKTENKQNDEFASSNLAWSRLKELSKQAGQNQKGDNTEPIDEIRREL